MCLSSRRKSSSAFAALIVARTRCSRLLALPALRSVARPQANSAAWNTPLVPVVERPGGAEIFWEESGDGPTVLVSPSYIQHPGVFSGLVAELAKRHRVVRYDARGSGASSRGGPYDMRTDVDDLLAVAEAAGPVAAVLGNGDGANRAVHAA